MIKRLRLKGFRRYVDETFELGPGVTFIDGKNNAGKSTLFLAIEYALTGGVAGARSQAMLLNPDVKGMGVEIVFVGRDGKTYKLQRLHLMPPRSRSRLVGHFTLKEVVGPDDERYLLSSDFQDHEDALAKKLAELTGITRRVFELAVHLKQGDIAAILEGDPKLDIALGITAAGTANEEMRTLALIDEEAAGELPALEASLEHLEKQRGVAAADEAALTDKLAALVAEAGELAKASDADDDAAQAREARLARLVAAADALRNARSDRDRAIAGRGDPGERAEVEAQLAAIRPDDTALRYDLRARIRRRTATLEAGAAACESCGAGLDLPRARAELATWQSELAAMDRATVDEPALRAKLLQLEAAAQAVVRAERAVEIASAQARRLAPDDDRPFEQIVAERRTVVEQARLERAATRARNEARQEALGRSIDELEERVTQHAGRGGELDREYTRVAAAALRLRQRKRRGEELRVLAAAFKHLQEQLRTSAATELAARTFAIHQALAVDHDIEAIVVDPTRYQVLVTPRSTGQAMPAALAQGGGHRMLIGLAFRLALVERLGPVPFVLLDEPTYGLDERHRLALLDRIATLGLCDQILLITHQAMGDATGARIVIDQGKAAVA